MRLILNKLKIRVFFLCVSLLVLLNSCISVPKETVELSYSLGKDISSIKSSYITLINEYFDLLSEKRLNYLDNIWTPRFIKEWVRDGKLHDISTGAVIWSPEALDFIIPQNSLNKEESLKSIVFWSNAAIEQINNKRKELIKPLSIEKKELIAEIENAFDRLYRSNAAITSYLSSIQKISEIQDSTLEDLKLSDIQNNISQKLISISKKADEELEEIKKADME